MDDLRTYYEEEARLRLRTERTGRRIELRDDFVQLLQREGRVSVVDYGAGPGLDGDAFVAAGHRFVGLDLAGGNGRLAAERGITVVQGSVTAPPFRPAAFDAGWSMSTLMHLEEADLAPAVTAMLETLRPNAPLLIGLWGGELGDVISDTDIEGHARRFNLRPFDRSRRLLAACGLIERASTLDLGPDGWNYQVFLIRARPARQSALDSPPRGDTTLET